MPGYQPRNETDPVWFNGNQVNSLTALTAAGGVGVHITAVYGWDDRPDVRDVRENRSGQDGEYADNLYLGGRTITIEGTVQGSTWANLQVRKRALAAIFNPSSTEALLKIPDPATASPTAVYAETGMTGYERCYCRVIEAIQFGEMLDPNSMSFQVILRASDPRIYSDVVTSTDSGTSGTASRTVTVDQGGTYNTPVQLTVTGPTGALFGISEPSSGLALTEGITLSSTDTVAFDTSDRTVVYTSSYEGVRVAQPSMVAMWMLDEAAGTTADNEQGAAGYDGTYTGGFTLNQAGPVTGLASVALNGTTGYVAIPYSANLYPDPLTFEGWIKLDTLTGTQTVLDCITSNRGWRFDIHTSGTPRITAGNGSTTVALTIPTSFTFAASTWYHVSIRHDIVSGYWSMNVNGSYLGSAIGVDAAESTPADPTATGYRFGSTMAGASFFDGNIAAFALFSSYAVDESNQLYEAIADTSSVSGYADLVAASTTWANLGTGSSTFTLTSSGLNTGSKLNVSYRDARL